MKKLVSLALCAFSAFAILGATLQTVTDPKPGELGLKASGRIAAVDVFSTVADGTVEISRVFSAPFYTNAYDTTSTVVTNIVSVPIKTPSYVRFDSVVFTNGFTASENLRIFENSTGTNTGRLSWIGVGGVGEWKYMTNWGLDPDSGEYKYLHGVVVSDKLPDEKILLFRDGQDEISFDRTETIVGYDVTTNIVTVVTTNSVTPVKAYDLTVTNAIFSGSCEGNCFHGVPSPDVWVFPGDKILFNGTATGGALRIVIE